jgi:hypothetical protein
VLKNFSSPFGLENIEKAVRKELLQKYKND